MALFKNASLNKAFPRSKVVDQIDEVDNVATKVMIDRIASMGETDSGAYSFYRVRADRSRLTVPLEIKVRDYILDNFKNIDSIHDVGAGIGTLAMAFASLGVNSVAIELDSRRVNAGLEIQAALMTKHKNVAKKLRFIRATFPSDEIDSIRRPGTLAVSTNIMGTLPNETQIQMIKGLSKYRAAIVDLQRFGATRKYADEIIELVDYFLQNGFKTADVGLDLGADGLFYCFGH